MNIWKWIDQDKFIKYLPKLASDIAIIAFAIITFYEVKSIKSLIIVLVLWSIFWFGRIKYEWKVK